MDKINIPLYRAKKIDSDEIVIGDYCNGFIIVSVLIDTDLRIFKIERGYQIDPTTLAIHFPNMIANDSDRLLPNGEKDLRIFASLSEDGKGGDTLEHKRLYDKNDYIWTIIWDSYRLTPFGVRKYWNPLKVPLCDLLNPKEAKIIGIKQ